VQYIPSHNSKLVETSLLKFVYITLYLCIVVVVVVESSKIQLEQQNVTTIVVLRAVN